MAYWLMKTEPNEYSYDNLVNEGITVWDGISNALALKYLRTMKIGDTALIYHTGKERKIVGTAETVSLPYPNPTLDDPKLLVIKVKVGNRICNPIHLKQIKQDEYFAGFDLVKLPRLSIVPVSVPYWQRLQEMANG
ncbi:hypothetical protein RINTHM_10800 [Richelia intracellularis HM01]|uniref:EVE domain-containing protein n=1 Tax=Richelia intracellularis TaxID=1164990 RepID=UPI0002B5B3F8|nr:EVE domain-containing protein [Richelia intracellularis]CCH65540.1 hypothetical protein RINTHM_10800 [Richelia intracellularis HM01]